MTRNSLSGYFAAKSSAAFSAAAGSDNAIAALYASNSGCVLACGGRFPCGAAAAFWPAAAPCPAGGFLVVPLSCPTLPMHSPSTATTIAARFMRSPRVQLNLLRICNLAFYRSAYGSRPFSSFQVVTQLEIQNFSELGSSGVEPPFRRREGSPTHEISGKEIPESAEKRQLS